MRCSSAGDPQWLQKFMSPDHLHLDEVLTVVLELVDRLVDVGKRLVLALLDPTSGELRFPPAPQLLQRRHVEMTVMKVIFQRRHPAREETSILADRIPAHRRDARRAGPGA